MQFSMINMIKKLYGGHLTINNEKWGMASHNDICQFQKYL